jgi:hypothetical protein
LDLSNKDIGRATSNSATGTPIVTTAKTAGLTVPNSHIVNITNSITTKPIKRPFIAVLIIAPKAASVGGLFVTGPYHHLHRAGTRTAIPIGHESGADGRQEF